MKFYTENISIDSLDGYTLTATLDVPTSADIKGGFLLLHGCPSYKDEYGFYGYESSINKIGMSEYFASRGYVCLRFNYRSQGKDLSPNEMNDLSINGMVNDTEAAFLLLNQMVGQNIYVVATSFAGAIALQWAQGFQHDISHLFLMCPLLEIRDTLRSRNIIAVDSYGQEKATPEVVDALNQQGYIISGDRKMTRAFINEILAVNAKKAFVDFAGTSTIFHGTMDTSVDYNTSVEYQKLSSEKCELILMKDLLHGFGPRKDMGYSPEERSCIKYKTWQNIYAEMEKRLR